MLAPATRLTLLQSERDELLDELHNLHSDEIITGVEEAPLEELRVIKKWVIAVRKSAAIGEMMTGLAHPHANRHHRAVLDVSVGH